MMFNQGTLKRKLLRETDDQQCICFQRTLQVTPDMIHRLGLEKDLEGHQGCVNCLEWNDKGTLLASGSDDVQIIVWNPFRHKRLTTIRTGHQGNIFSLKFLPNSNDSIIVSGAADCKIRVHDVNIQETTHVFGCHAGRVKRLATAPNVPFMFWSAAEDGTIMQFDLRTPIICDSTPQNVLINLNAHMGLHAEAKCIAINPLRPDEMAVGANDPYVRVYDRRMLSCKSIKFPTDNGSRLQWDSPVTPPSLREEDYNLHSGCVQYFVAGHLPQKQMDYRKRYRTLASTYVTYSPDGSELLVNLGGEQIYLFDVNKKRKPQKFDTSLVLGNANGIVKEATLSTNGFSVPHRAGTNGVTTPMVPKSSRSTSPSSSTTSLQAEDDPEKFKCRIGKRYKRDTKRLSPPVEALKKKANNYFEKDQCRKAIILYNQAISMMPHASVLYGNRAAAYMKRKWDGDLYAALRDCHSALQLDLNYLKAHFRLARCLYELSWPQEAHDCLQQFKSKFPDYARNSACETLDRDIKAAMFSKTDHDEAESGKSESELSSRKKAMAISEQEKIWRRDAYDYEMRFCGHCNTTTDIKEANFFGSNGQYIVAGSDDGSFFIWEKSTTNIVRVLHGDESIVNCLQPHPTYCLLATSGIDPVVRLWSPRAEDGTKNEREIDNSDDAALANQRRMNADPLEVMLMNMGYRITGVLDMDDEDQESGPSTDSRSEQHLQCRPS
ncbi:and tetratricopeptide repeats 1-like [Octopus vulgaris]|uniref:And tetratricopeptide repeats 1-like n=3 Tax=Octopus TaxID=6643 RepID=A0AA36EZG0_OCTVU|nr:WD and tetratricopeptide repeats protein 1 isoform X1 [Octopus bimaculoides]XP_014775312.1 WD and tetratricopeptide repeats protein 1 isoform X1 [Octopus bimaculoides]XP_029654796.1 WD and tetratricopeptide repeats protein 1 isoform X1 [Octopus sinensis]XP_036367368.1 WD and tetratricopeptide repeats protein 1 isoform X1 [Octopus sinensis]XP_036367374.1 WD and tetratricopeptide repeats protein 1 isoform X1 [Octopus sinensis]CAI9718792.1 and tetratricopeptide repeats 1-like [Octopus vulgaris|eukprot:XP_014775311.1 PREDICTED: WD and tetratricopeptide repeats protein 1-like isoform X1 [Octopus bimaculoides]